MAKSKRFSLWQLPGPAAALLLNGAAQALELPPIAAPPGRDATLAGQPWLFVREIRLRGNRVFSRADLAGLIAPYQNRQVSADELQTLRQQLTQHYVERGYVNSGAVLPDQQVNDGVIYYDITEGRLTATEIIGNDRLRTDYITAVLDHDPGQALYLPRLQERLRLLQQDALIERLDAELSPGERPGEARLTVAVEEAAGYRFGAALANDRPPSVGGEQLQLSATRLNLSGRGDSLGLSFGLADGGDDFAGFYRLPLAGGRNVFDLSYEQTDAEVIEQPFADLDIVSDTRTLSVAASHALWRIPQASFSLSLTLDHRRAETRLLGRRFSFDGSASDGVSRVTALRFAQDWLRRSPERVLAARSIFSVGLDWFGATDGDGGPGGRFFSWRGQLQWAARLDASGRQLVFRADVQLADSPLLSLEKFAVGGTGSVRGYRRNLLLRDNALVASLEVRQPLTRLPLAGLSRGPDDGWLRLALFADAARAWNKNSPTPDPDSIASLGLGLLWDPSAQLHAELYWGRTLRRVDTAERDLQDRGLHFRLEWRYP